MRLFSLAVIAATATASLAVPLFGCGPTSDPNVSGRAPVADKWLTRAQQSFKSGDFDDAKEAATSALQAAPRDLEIRLLNARIALAKLDFQEALKLTEGLETTEVHSIRGRARWYLGDIDQAADELDAMLRDPGVKDPWARDISRLARRGTGRHPFAMEGGLVASIEMPKIGPILVVPCELEGERILAMVATASGEVVVDSNTRKEPAWVNLRFGDRIEVKDVPALTQDLSAISRQLGAPIKAMLGVNLLRHLHVTLDRRGDQFVVRREDPPAPPEASRLPLWYVRGGGMLVRAAVNAKDDGKAVFLVDSTVVFPMALEDDLWRKAGVDLTKMQPEPSLGANMKSGIIPGVKLGSFDLPRIPAVQGAALGEVKNNVDVDLGGVLGAGLLAAFRITLADEGRYMWLEPDPAIAEEARRERAASQGAPPNGPPPGAAPTPAGPAPSAPGTPAAPGKPPMAPDAPKAGAKPGAPAPSAKPSQAAAAPAPAAAKPAGAKK